jgi:hypothetical protein
LTRLQALVDALLLVHIPLHNIGGILGKGRHCERRADDYRYSGL